MKKDYVCDPILQQYGKVVSTYENFDLNIIQSYCENLTSVNDMIYGYCVDENNVIVVYSLNKYAYNFFVLQMELIRLQDQLYKTQQSEYIAGVEKSNKVTGVDYKRVKGLLTQDDITNLKTANTLFGRHTAFNECHQMIEALLKSI